MCFHIIPLCPDCEEPSGLGEEVIYSDEVCCGHCPPEDVCGSTTRIMTKSEVRNPDFECSTPGCGDAVTNLTAAEEEAEVQRARDHAKRFLREAHENCRSLCILPFMDDHAPPSEVILRESLYASNQITELKCSFRTPSISLFWASNP
jgi:hypothetical protein